MNLSTNAIENNREIGIVTSDSHVIRMYNTQFDKDRNTSRSYANHARKNP